MKRLLLDLIHLSRCSNLPTVLSNVLLAIFFFSSSFEALDIFLCLFGGFHFYTAGMYFNDYFDLEHDKIYQPHRPLASGQVTKKLVLVLSLLFLAIANSSYLVLAVDNNADPSFYISLFALNASILFYNYKHKNFSLSPIVMGLCRSTLILTTVYATANPIGWNPILLSLIIGSYVAGFTFWVKGFSRTLALLPLVFILFIPLTAIFLLPALLIYRYAGVRKKVPLLIANMSIFDASLLFYAQSYIAAGICLVMFSITLGCQKWVSGD